MKKKQENTGEVEATALQSQAVLAAERKSKALRRISICAIVATVAYILPKLIAFNFEVMYACANLALDNRARNEK